MLSSLYPDKSAPRPGLKKPVRPDWADISGPSPSRAAVLAGRKAGSQVRANVHHTDAFQLFADYF